MSGISYKFHFSFFPNTLSLEKQRRDQADALNQKYHETILKKERERQEQDFAYSNGEEGEVSSSVDLVL